MSQRLTDTESLLWSLEGNPNLSATMGAIALLEAAPTYARFRNTMARAVTKIERLGFRVQESPLPLNSPSWVIDQQFDLDYHVRAIRLPARSDMDTFRRLAAQLFNDPFDRARPLWQFTLVTGLPNSGAAVIGKVHHSIADGLGALKLAEHVLEFAPDAKPPKKLDIASHLTKQATLEQENQASLADGIRHGAERVVQLINDAASSIIDPSKIASVGNDAVSTARTIAGQIPGTTREGSALWKERSRNRRLVWTTLPLAPIKQRSKELGVSLNDLFVAACSEAAIRYHEKLQAELPTISATVVVSTRNAGNAETDNAFIPAAVTIPGADTTTKERLDSIHKQVLARREAIESGSDLLASIGGLAGLIPRGAASALAFEQAQRVDFATSNLPGPPIPCWIAGKAITELIPVGPVAGTAANMTLLSCDGNVSIGLHVDPLAIQEPDLLIAEIANSFAILGVNDAPH